MKIVNVSASNCFVDVLAQKLLTEFKDNPLGLADVLIFLPNRRACRSLAEAFVRLQGMQPTLLPCMKAIGDVEADELVLRGNNVQDVFAELPAVIDPLERTMLFMRLIMGRYQDFGLEKIKLAQACSLAQELGSLIDKVEMFGLDWANLQNLAPEEYASHWQETLKFLEIVTRYWPEILRERGVVDAGQSKNKLIKKQCEIWQKQKPEQRIIVAGTTAVSPVMKDLVKTVSDLPNGEVWLSGLDKFLDDEDWEKIDETHPQFELKQLIDFLNLKRDDVAEVVVSANVEREKLISELMRPAESSEKWRDIKGKINDSAWDGLKIIECNDQREEALTIAVLIRKFLEEKEKTIALITPDRNLARRVSAQLQRWNVDVDDSAGIPLLQTPWGIFMRLCVEAVLPNAKKEQLLALMKHEMFCLKKEKDQLDLLVQKTDKNVWRQGQECLETEELLKLFYDKAAKFKQILMCKTANIKDILTEHMIFAEALAQTVDLEGADVLWRGEDGEAGAGFVANWLSKADVLGEIETAEYLSLFEAMMSGIMVRKKGNRHQRIRILGPIEARLNHYNKIILGGFNEGVWPVSAQADPWMSRPMKKDFGFEQPEKQIGVLALDLCNLLGGSDVYITRSELNSGNPTIKSRWLMRLETVLQALQKDKKDIFDDEDTELATRLDEAGAYIKIEAPCPTPPVSARPRKMSASAFEKLLRDPYSVYAEYILRLKPLEDLEKDADMRDLGNIVHGVLEEFGNKYPTKYPDNAFEILTKMATEVLDKSGVSIEKQAFWRPRIEKMMKWVAETERDYRRSIKKVHNEIWGRFFIEDLPGGKFEIFAKADRVDEVLGDGINIIDYKTGRTRTATEVKKGYAPQLPIEGLIAEKGGFDGIEKAKVNALMYWKLGDKTVKIEDDINKILDDTEQHIKEVVNLFDFKTTGYLSRPNPKAVPEYSDYEHLARVKEWSVKDDGDEA